MFAVDYTDLQDLEVKLDVMADGLPGELELTLHEIGRETRDLARMIAQDKGLDGTGKYSPSRDPHPGALIQRIRVTDAHHGYFAEGARTVAITEYSASHSRAYPEGYSYPRRYEYGAGDDRERAFMHPALGVEEPLLEMHFRGMLARLGAAVGLEA